VNRAGFIGAVAGLALTAAMPRAMAASLSPTLAPFHAIRIMGTARLTYTRAAAQTVTLTGSEGLLRRVRLTVEDGVLVLRLKRGTWFGDESHPDLTVATPRLDRLDVSGMASGRLSGLQGRDFAVQVAGTGRLTLSGAVKQMSVSVSGAGKVDATRLIAQDLRVDISGTGSVSAYASKAAHIEISGVGSAHIAGHPAVRDVSRSGIGSVVFD